MDKMFFFSWESIVRTVVITVLAYILLIFILRISGKRTLSKMNAFDFIVTIALGSTLATVLLNKSVALVDGVLAFSLLIGLQYLITYFSVRSERFSNIVKSTPTLLVYRGYFLDHALKKERVSKNEIHSVIRAHGLSSIEEVGAIVLETDGTFTLIKNLESMKTSTMSYVESPPDLPNHD
jgi:uncharacterized membrane protein YcaP (DUF421 family)